MIKVRRKKSSAEVNSSSMADIAFLLFIFFLITTTIVTFKGVEVILPPPVDENEPPKPLPERNVFKVYINFQDQVLVEDKPYRIDEIKEYAKRFITNYKKDPDLSDNPKVATIAMRSDRGTSYKAYMQVMDQLEGAYNELRAEYLNLSIKQYLKLDQFNAVDAQKIKGASKKYPWNLAESEASDFKE